MSYLKFVPDLFLEAAELNRFKQFVDDNGFRKSLLNDTVSFGLIKHGRDANFTNGRVERDLDTTLGQRTIKVRELFGIDKSANFLHLAQTNGIAVPADGAWYWLKVAYAISNLEKGTFSISGNGDLVDDSGTAELLSIFRGMPNFPTRIKFVGSVYNTLEYDVLEVIDNLHATLQHPATSTNGISEFVPESNLQIKIVGTFTQGIAVPTANKYPFNYDSATVTLVAESFVNTQPVINDGEEFLLARIQATNTTVIIQDKRTQFWQTKGSGAVHQIDRAANPLIGIESSQFNHLFTPSDRNIVKVAWGLRSTNWSVDSNNNIVTFNSGLGGKYKSVNDFQNGDLVGGRLYAPNGKYGKIIGSIKQGSAINFTLDVLDVNNFSVDGGQTFVAGTAFVSPDCEEVEILFTPDPTDKVSAITEKFVFPVNTPLAKCDVLVYKDPTCLYNVQYRYKSFKEFGQWVTLPTDAGNGYYLESSFDDNGNLKTTGTAFFPYKAHPTNGFIQLTISPYAISKFRSKVDKGDIIGVNTINNLTGIATLNLVVGVDKNYQLLTGNLTLPNDVVFNLDKGKAVEGNEFRIHIDCSFLDLNGHSISIVQDAGQSSQKTLKLLKQGDVYQMKNVEGGLCFDLKYNGSTWVMYQNYEWGRPYEIISLDGAINALFDAVTGMGKVRGLYGFAICDQQRNVDGVEIPDLSKTFLIGAKNNLKDYDVTNTGGEETHKLTRDELPKFDISIDVADPDKGPWRGTLGKGGTNNFNVTLGYIGSDVPHNNMPPYYAVIKAKRVF